MIFPCVVTMHVVMFLFLLKKKVCSSFDFGEWRKHCADWLRTKRLRAADLFRQQDRSNSGTLSRRQFVDAMTSASE